MVLTREPELPAATTMMMLKGGEEAEAIAASMGSKGGPPGRG